MRILYVSGYDLHAENIEAAAICSKELVDALSALPYVSVKTVSENIFFEEKKRFWKRGIPYSIKKLYKWPCSDPDAERRCFAELTDELGKNNYDAIIVSHLPFDTVRAAIRYKKRHPSIRLYLYATDPIARDILKHWRKSHKYLFLLSKRAELITFQKFDYIINMQCNDLQFQAKRYYKYRKKFLYADFPLIHDLNRLSCDPVLYNYQQLKIVYSGTLYSGFRSPKYMTDVLRAISEKVNFEMEFYSKGNCEDYLDDLSRRDNHFHACGYIPKAELDAVMEEADAYVNIGNKYSSMLPSKLLTYFEQGKPVIHVSNQDGDACLPYMERYPLGLVIRESDPVEVSAQKVTEFLRSTYRQRVSSEEICRIFYKNTPEWSAKEIVKVIERDMSVCANSNT